MTSIAKLLEDQATHHGSKPFVFCEGEEISYQDMHDRACRVAANLAKHGVGKGDKVVLLMGNCVEFLDVFLAAGRIGAVIVPINPLLKPDEIVYISDNADAETLVIIPEFAPFLPMLGQALPKVKRVFVLGDGPLPEGSDVAVPFSELLDPAGSAPDIAAEASDDAALIYTSGTTGMPKGVILTHKNYLANALGMLHQVDMSRDDRFLLVLPLFHVNSQVISVVTPLMAGADVVLMKKFQPFKILPTIEEHRVTVMSAVPTIYNVMSRMPKADQYDIDSIRFFVTGAAPMPRETYDNVLRVLKKPLISGYGLSEATCGSAAADYRDPIKWDSVGTPLRFNLMRIVAEDGADAAIGGVGEILIAGPTVMKGYYKNPEATAETVQGGWLHTGDMGRFDEDGYLYIVGRVKDMIIRGGQNVYPQQVENVVSTFEGVEECCVVGVEEARWGQEILAVIKPVEGVTLEEDALMQHCRDNLAAYKCPRFVRFVEELPKTATGKIRKVEVAAQFADIAKG